MVKRILRFEVPVDDQPHPIPDARVVFGRHDPNPFGLGASAQVWVEVSTLDGWPAEPLPVGDRLVQVVSTGDPVPESWTWLTSFADGTALLHLFEVSS